VAFGADAVSPPDTDPYFNPTGVDWLAVREGVGRVHGRPTTTTNNGWEMEIRVSTEEWISCPRPQVGELTSIWLVTIPLTNPGLAADEWNVDSYLEYRAFT
jgi:hypothetical protein